MRVLNKKKRAYSAVQYKILHSFKWTHLSTECKLMYSSWVFQVVITMCPNLSAVSLSGTICWETMHYMWASTVKKKKENLTSKKKGKRFKQQNKTTVQKDGLHFAVRHNAHGLQVYRFNNYNTSPSSYTRVCLCVETHSGVLLWHNSNFRYFCFNETHI